MVGNRRISEKDLVLPALFLMSVRGVRNTSDLIKELAELLQPSGKDIEILAERKDTKFSQKVRNLVCHDTWLKLGYATCDQSQKPSLHKITEKGNVYLSKNMEAIDYLLSNNFSYEDIKKSFNDIVKAAEKGQKVITYDENLVITEGMRKKRNITLYERSSKLRNIALEYYTVAGHIKCYACVFDFYNFYGKIGKGFIEIHHIRPIFRHGGEEKRIFLERALKNTAPVCSNCHRVIHRNKYNPLSIKLLKEYIKKNGKFER